MEGETPHTVNFAFFHCRGSARFPAFLYRRWVIPPGPRLRGAKTLATFGNSVIARLRQELWQSMSFG
jgi:hypothetical protein